MLKNGVLKADLYVKSADMQQYLKSSSGMFIIVRKICSSL